LATAGSSNSVTAADTHNNNSPGVVLQVPNAAITVTPTVAKWGDTVTVTGTGFRGGTSMTVTIPSGVGANIFPTAVYTDGAGNFTGTFVMPSIDAGVQTIGATDGLVTGTTSITVMAAPPSVSTALSTCAGKYTVVWNYDAQAAAWTKYDPTAPAYANTLSTLTDGSAYWVVATANCTVTYGAKVRPLYTGPNNIGW